MSILINENTRLLVQGITGREGEFHTRQMKLYGTNVVAGVTPGKGGLFVDNIPVFNTVWEAKKETGANASCIFVPAPFAKDAILEAIDSEIELIVCITEGIPTLDMCEVISYLKNSKSILIGPNCPGIVSPPSTKVGIIPNNICSEGPVGILSRSGTLTYEIINELTARGIGQTTCIGVGGDQIIGSRFIDLLPLFENDSKTKVVILVGEIGGNDEEIAAEYIKNNFKKKVIGFISGKTAPEGKRMGHAGAIISGKSGTAESKINAFHNAGIIVANTISEIIDLTEKAL